MCLHQLRKRVRAEGRGMHVRLVARNCFGGSGSCLEVDHSVALIMSENGPSPYDDLKRS